MALPVPAGVASLVGLSGGKNARERLREGAYESPSGTRIKYLFTDLRRTGKARGTAWEFPGVNGAYIQRKGIGPRQYPLRIFFSGPDHDLVATAFEVAIYEDGVGKLEHPRYGLIPHVVPFGGITRRDDLVTEGNQTVIEVTFWTTLTDIYPSGKGNPKSEIEAALGSFDVVAAQEFDAATDLATVASQASTKATIKGMLRTVSAAIQSVSDATTMSRREFDDITATINQGIDVLIGQPLLLARQLADLARAPARALSGIRDRLDGYRRLLDSLMASDAGTISSTVAVTQLGLRLKRKNNYQVAQHLAMNAVAGSIASVLNHEFATKPEAVAAANEIAQQFDDLVAWREQAYEDLEEIDTGGAYQQLQQAVALTAGFLVEISFSLVAERRIVLDRPRTIIDVAAEVYGKVDNDTLDLLINSNELTGSEILELPRGRTIAYYPEG